MLKLKKSLGQNLLIDKNIINKILSMTDIKNKNILEIGPGTGNLTKSILEKKPKKLLLIEKDKNFCDILYSQLDNFNNYKVFNEDILKLDLNSNFRSEIIFGNLPYNISTKIFTNLVTKISWPPKYKSLILMFQKEVGEKIIAKFKTKNYGRLSLLSNFRLDVLNKFIVSKNCFFPKPKVDSMVIHFKPKKNNKFEIKEIKNI